MVYIQRGKTCVLSSSAKDKEESEQVCIYNYSWDGSNEIANPFAIAPNEGLL